ncbi:MAG: NAD(P)/FAD-dependent oxidoreductase [Clostridia bacterium]|nr:NAD(P)/FAD-dependent oxidoreductase [Clostridia bacterium]
MDEFVTDTRRVAVIGGGAAGMMAAATAAEYGASVTLYERNDRFGKKLRITGKGRCNVTNDCTMEEFLANVPRNPRFLYAALSAFSTEDTKAHFEALGVPLKTERGRRVFPVSDKAADIVAAMERYCRDLGVCMVNRRVSDLLIEEGRVRGVRIGGSEEEYDAVIVCTGGKSYPLTGSDGDGYQFARRAGHTVVSLRPSLVPIVCAGNVCSRMQGLSLKNVTLRMVDVLSGKTVYEEFGEMMFTHFGITGPLVLSASAHVPDLAPGRYEARIDLKPALDEKTLDERILSDFSGETNKNFENALDALLPRKMIPLMVEASGIDPLKKVHSVTREERRRLVSCFKQFTVRPTGFRPIDEAIVTSGGVSVKEITPKTMESKLVKGLYFAGEVLDVDAYTGGYNLQIAFSTGRLAGMHAAELQY